MLSLPRSSRSSQRTRAKSRQLFHPPQTLPPTAAAEMSHHPLSNSPFPAASPPLSPDHVLNAHLAPSLVTNFNASALLMSAKERSTSVQSSRRMYTVVNLSCCATTVALVFCLRCYAHHHKY